jgi:DNA mismatch repair protein MutS2
VGQPDAPDVVPSDVELRAGQALIISGPNAGGKSVLLKAMGLAALLTRAGLPVPCAADATVYPYEVFADIGDGQSIGNNLSTFSSHLARMAKLLEATGRDSLILLDEICSGTEPREGEVLATALLEALVARGATVVVTTHYDALKLRALHDARFRNSSMATEPDRHAPTFSLVLDLPGRAWALELAAREPALRAVTERARELLREDPSRSSGGARLDEALDGLATLRTQWQAELAAVQAERERAEAKEAAREAEMAALRARGTKQATRELAEVFATLSGVKAALDAAVTSSTRANVADAAARLQDLRQTFTNASERAREAERLLRKPLSGALAAGARVYVASLGAIAVVESERDDIVRLRFGSLSVSAPRAELFAPSEADVARDPSSRSVVGASRDPRSATKLPATPPPAAPAADDLHEEPPLPSRDNTLDLRGEPLAELMASWSAFRAHAMGAGLSHVYVLHGFGARRERLRDLLRHDARVAFYRAADAADGGDGTTLVRLRASSR